MPTVELYAGPFDGENHGLPDDVNGMGPPTFLLRRDADGRWHYYTIDSEKLAGTYRGPCDFPKGCPYAE